MHRERSLGVRILEGNLLAMCQALLIYRQQEDPCWTPKVSTYVCVRTDVAVERYDGTKYSILRYLFNYCEFGDVFPLFQCEVE